MYNHRRNIIEDVNIFRHIFHTHLYLKMEEGSSFEKEKEIYQGKKSIY